MKPTVSDRMMRRALGKFHLAHRRIESREDLIHRDDAGARDLVEECRLAGIGVTDDRDNRIRHLASALAVQIAGFLDICEVALDRVDAVLKHAAVEFDLCFARAAKKATAAALAFQVRPGADETALLVGQVRKLDLKHAFARSRPCAKNLEDQSGSIDDLRVPRFLKITLLHRRDDVIDDDKADFEIADGLFQLVHLAGAKQRRRTRFGERDDRRLDHVEVDRFRQADGFGETIFRCVNLRKRLRLFADADLALPHRHDD